MTNDLRRLLKAAEAQGFTVRRTSKGHWLVRNAEGRAIATVFESGDWRAWRNALAALRRAGLIWPPKFL